MAVLTIEGLNLQVRELEKQYEMMLNSLGNKIVNFILKHQTAMAQTKIKIDLIHNQINELVKEKQKLEKEQKEKEQKKEEGK